MKELAFRKWLENEFTSASASTRLSSAKAVEEKYGDLDEHIAKGKIDSLLERLRYSKEDERLQKENPTLIDIQGNPYNRLNNCKNGVRTYARFIEIGGELAIEEEVRIEALSEAVKAKKEGQKFRLETHLQNALRREIEQLERGLSVVDDGYELSVNSGDIDITAQDENGAMVVIELKRDMARRDTIGQICGYMGDLVKEEGVDQVRGIIVAGEFDKSCEAAVRVIPNLKLVKYRFEFAFEEIL